MFYVPGIEHSYKSCEFLIREWFVKMFNFFNGLAFVCFHTGFYEPFIYLVYVFQVPHIYRLLE